jgi:hypothetical protein
MCLQPCNLLDFSTVASIEAWAQRVATMWSTPVLRMCCCISYPPRTARYTFPGQEVGQAARRACVQRLFEAGRIPKAVCVRFSLLYKVSRTRIPSVPTVTFAASYAFRPSVSTSIIASGASVKKSFGRLCQLILITHFELLTLEFIVGIVGIDGGGAALPTIPTIPTMFFCRIGSFHAQFLRR